jgi:hypothetical protein
MQKQGNEWIFSIHGFLFMEAIKAWKLPNYRYRKSK